MLQFWFLQEVQVDEPEEEDVDDEEEDEDDGTDINISFLYTLCTKWSIHIVLSETSQWQACSKTRNFIFFHLIL